MLESINTLRQWACVGLVMVLLVACSSKQLAPVEVRTSVKGSASTVETPAPIARPGFYVVKKGDTLYSIAHQFERDYREIAAWNGLDDPNVIKVGQEIRVIPVVETVASRPVQVGSGIESRPVNPSASISSAVASTTVAPVSSVPVSASSEAGVKTEPKGGRLAYSPQAWKDLQAVTDRGTAPVPAVKPEPAVSKPAASEGAPATGSGSAAGDDVEWIWPGSGKVIASFNDSSNKGVDIGGSAGDPVLAAGGGKVVYVGNGLRGYGNLVIIKHNNIFLSAYAHNSEILVKEGQAVQKGQKIAAMGSSDADRVKLHFEIRRQGKPVDPMKYLPAR